MQDRIKEQKSIFILRLAEIVKSHRLNMKKSIYTISAESSVPRSTWRDLEFGLKKDINLSTFCKIAEGLEISPDELLKELLSKLDKDFSFIDIN